MELKENLEKEELTEKELSEKYQLLNELKELKQNMIVFYIERQTCSLPKNR